MNFTSKSKMIAELALMLMMINGQRNLYIHLGRFNTVFVSCRRKDGVRDHCAVCVCVCVCVCVRARARV